MTVKIPYTRSAKVRFFIRKHWWQIAAIVVIAAIIYASFDFVWFRIQRHYYIGITAYEANYLIPIENPANNSEIFSMDIKMNSTTFAAQATIPTKVTLYPSNDYKKPVSVLNNTNYPKAYYVLFQGSECTTDDPDSNFAIGHQCIFELEQSVDGTKYVTKQGAKGKDRSLFYNFDGNYGVLLATNSTGEWQFGNSSHGKFIQIEPASVVYDIAYSKLTLFMTAFAIEVAFLGTVIVIILKKH